MKEKSKSIKVISAAISSAFINAIGLRRRGKSNSNNQRIARHQTRSTKKKLQPKKSINQTKKNAIHKGTECGAKIGAAKLAPAGEIENAARSRRTAFPALRLVRPVDQSKTMAVPRHRDFDSFDTIQSEPTKKDRKKNKQKNSVP